MRQTGVVKWFNDSKGFGFVACDDKNVGDCFVHYSDITAGEGRKTLREGTSVEFDVETTDKGLRAKNVTPAAA